MARITLAIIITLLAAGATPARIITVDNDNPADFNNIQAAINDANDGDTVEIQPGTYTGDGNRDIDFLGKPITVRSTDPNDPDVVSTIIIDCQGNGADPHRGFVFQNDEGASSVVSGLTIANGYGPDELIWDDSPPMRTAGGGIICKAASPTISNCVLQGHEADFGSAMFLKHAGPTVSNCTVKDNRPGSIGVILCVDSSPVISGCSLTNNEDGVAIACYDYSEPIVTDSAISGNYTAIEARYDNHLIVSNCTIRDNHTGIYCYDESAATITGCTIADSWGGAGLEFDRESHSTVSNCIITGNLEGGVYCNHSDVAFTNSTINDNGIDYAYADGIYARFSNIVITNCIMRGNDGSQIRLGSDASLLVTFSNIEGGSSQIYVYSDSTVQWDPTNTDAEPFLDADYRLTNISPCINTGGPEYPDPSGEVDIDGEPRVINGRIDRGADEFNYEGPVLYIFPAMWEFSAPEGSSSPQTQALSVLNIGQETMNWQISHDYPWLEITPISGQSRGEEDIADLSADVSSFPRGTHRFELLVSGDPALNNPLVFPITLHILDNDGSLDVPSEYQTIQAAIDNSNDGDTVVVSDGVYTGPGNRDIDFLGKAITVKSENGPANCIIDCSGTAEEPHRGFEFHSGEDEQAVLKGVTIINGYTTDRDAGGAIKCDQSSPTITHCIFARNSAYWDGGAIDNYKSSPAILNCQFIENEAVANDGGAINNYTSSPTIANCTFKANSAYDWGGGMRNIYDSSPLIINCLFTRNHAGSYGGAILNYDSTVEIINCTFGDNLARYGSAVSSEPRTYPNDSYATIANSIVHGNQPRQIYGDEYEISYSNVEGGWSGIGNIDADPCFAHFGYVFDPCSPDDPCDDIWIGGDYHLLGDSPCIDAADNTAVPSACTFCLEDLDGNPRFADDPCTADTGNGTAPIVDMGAYEGTRNATFLTVSTEEITVPEGGTAEFTVAVSSEITDAVEAAVTVYFGDPDITIKSGALLSFDANNYADPQTVTLQAAEDAFFQEGTAFIRIDASNCITAVIRATESDNDSTPNIMYVDQNATGANDGTVWNNAYTDLQTAIEAAELLSGLIDEIHVAQGRYTPAEPFSGDSNATFRLASGVAIKGGYAGYSQCSRFAQCAPYARDIRKYETILSGDINGDDDSGPDNTDENSETVVFAGPTDAAAILDGFTITNARAGYAGGGIHVDRSNPVIRNCTIIDNIADYYGGGIFVGYDSYLAIQNCIIAGNTARYGGGVYCSDRSALTITNSIITGNKSEYSGGACYFELSNVTISGCTISGNAAANPADCGRGCDNSLDRGPGIICYSSNVVVSDSILWGNSAPADPEVVLSDWWYDPTTFSISHSVIEGGRDAITLDENCTLDWRAGNIDGDPCFAEVGYWVHIDDPNIPVEPNDPNRAWTGGDYHLKSDHGRWDPNANAWVRDDVTSLCVDAGDPNADWTAELWPHGKQVNMGGYGGTAQASMSPNDVGNIADLDLDGFVYRTDLPLLVNAWLSSDVPLREDLTRDGIVDFPDFAVLALNWERPPLPAQAKILTPLDGAIEVSRTPVLSWISDANAVWHDVYLGTESPPVLQSCVSTTTFEPDVLSRNTQFYWRIDEINPAGITAGQVWNFQTGSSPDRATDPDPPDGMDDEWTMPWYIRWTPGDGAESHDVYFGTTNPPQFQTNQTAATFELGYLSQRTTYYWRIDEINADGKTTGTAWSFVTGRPKGEMCFPADTLVWADGRMVEISEVVAGAMVDKPAVAPTITELHKTVCAHQIEGIDVHNESDSWDRHDIVFENGNTFAVAYSHYFLLDSSKWACVEELTPGSKLSTLEGSVTIKRITKTKSAGTVYNLKIKDSDRYLVGKDGIIVRDW